MLNAKTPSEVQTFMKKFAHLRKRKPGIVDESNHDGSEQESFSEQEKFMRTEITFTLRKNGGYRTSGWAVNHFL